MCTSSPHIPNMREVRFITELTACALKLDFQKQTNTALENLCSSEELSSSSPYHPSTPRTNDTAADHWSAHRWSRQKLQHLKELRHEQITSHGILQEVLQADRQAQVPSRAHRLACSHCPQAAPCSQVHCLRRRLPAPLPRPNRPRSPASACLAKASKHTCYSSSDLIFSFLLMLTFFICAGRAGHKGGQHVGGARHDRALLQVPCQESCSARQAQVRLLITPDLIS